MTVLHPLADPAITSAEVLGRKTVKVGSRVKHFGQRYTGCATATVLGFRDVGHESPDHDGDARLPSWIKVLVEHDASPSGYDRPDGWDADRTEVAADIPARLTIVCQGCGGDGGQWPRRADGARDRRYTRPTGPCEACGGDGRWSHERQCALAQALSDRARRDSRGIPLYQWQTLNRALTSGQKERIKAKAAWEHVTWLGVLADWPSLFTELGAEC